MVSGRHAVLLLTGFVCRVNLCAFEMFSSVIQIVDVQLLNQQNPITTVNV